jgi:hypothetical protein
MATTAQLAASHQKLLARFSGKQSVDVHDAFWCGLLPVRYNHSRKGLMI